MDKLINVTLIAASLAVFSGCGDKQNQAERDEAVKQAIEQGMQKERAMMEGMVKGIENVEKKLTEQSETSKK